MKAYKCDICKKYCDNVYIVRGISEPKTHVVGRFKANDLECCDKCYDEICTFTTDTMDKHENTLMKGRK